MALGLIHLPHTAYVQLCLPSRAGGDHAVGVTGAVWLITGAQASGKSTVADLLAHRFERGVHVRGGQFSRWAVRGWVHFDDADRVGEARRLLDLRYGLSGLVADEYASAGFTTVVQDNIYGEDVESWLGRIRSRPLHLVVLRPSVDVIEKRHEDRRQRTGKIAYRSSYTAADNDQDVAMTRAGLGLWLDTSSSSPDETVREILARADEAIIN